MKMQEKYLKYKIKMLINRFFISIFYFYLIFLKASILSAVLGWVDHKLEVFLFPLSPFFLKGLMIYILAVAELAVSNSLGSFSNFSKAEIKPSGLRVNSTAVASAKNSLFL